MKIKIYSPFNSLYKSAYLSTNKEPRRVVTLVRHNQSRPSTSLSYARYLMSCHLDRFLEKDEHVDHKDDNALNDVIDNLQILTPKENNIKKNLALGIKLKDEITLNCPICMEDFTRPARNIENKLKKGKTPTCSRRCGGKMSHRNKD